MPVFVWIICGPREGASPPPPPTVDEGEIESSPLRLYANLFTPGRAGPVLRKRTAQQKKTDAKKQATGRSVKSAVLNEPVIATASVKRRSRAPKRTASEIMQQQAEMLGRLRVRKAPN